MGKKKIDITQIKESVVNELKTLSLEKKDRTLLLSLIELFDLLSEKKDDCFLNRLQGLILEKNTNNIKEFEARIYSLKTQVDSNKYVEIRHFPFFSFFFKKETIDVFPKKIPLSWDVLLNEIEKTNFLDMRVIVYKTISTREKISAVKLNNTNWKSKLTEILDNNVFANIRVILYLKKEDL